MAWARWRAGAGPGTEEGERLWDFEGRYGEDFTAAYCRSCPARCSDCPQPRLLPSAHMSVAAYLECGTQWQYAPSGVRTGLRYSDCMTALRAFARRHGLTRAQVDAAFAGVRTIEAATVAADVERVLAERARE